MTRWLAPLALAACAAGHGPAVLTLSTGCLNVCRAYTVEVHADGHLDYMGRANVALGRHEADLSNAQLAALDRVLAAGGFAQLAPRSCDETDLGTLVSIDYRGRHVDFFDLCNRTPAEAIALWKRLELVLGLERWLDEP